MNSLTAKRIDMLKEVKEFGITHAASFPATSLGKQLFDSVAQIVTELDSKGASQVSGRNSAQNIAAVKARIREDLRELLLAINRTARIMSVETAEFEGKFRLPRNLNDQKLLNAARAFVQDATPLKDSFIRHEMPADFLDQLSNLINSFDQAASQKTAAVSTHVAARLTIDENVGRGLQLVRQLDAIIRNKFNGDPVVLSAWIRASHVARRTRKDEEDETSADTNVPVLPK
ncbi:MAG TPA: hypothetical protein PLK30_15710 [Blastocatellia bacterium]|nr:hypothetical protein [Blastocatellia bacterium]